MDYASSRAVLDALERKGVRYAVFGAGAMNLLGLARFTEHLDLFVAPTADNIERLRRALREVFDDPSIEDITAADLLGDYLAVQHIPSAGAFRLDILTRLGEAFAFDAPQPLPQSTRRHDSQRGTCAELL